MVRTHTHAVNMTIACSMTRLTHCYVFAVLCWLLTSETGARSTTESTGSNMGSGLNTSSSECVPTACLVLALGDTRADALFNNSSNMEECY